MKKSLSVFLSVLMLFSSFYCVFGVVSFAGDDDFQYAYLQPIEGTDGKIPTIDIVNNLIYGIDFGADDFSQYVKTGRDNLFLHYTYAASGKIGSGSKVAVTTVKDDLSTAVATFETVMFGELNGDGVVDVLDAVLTERLSNHAITKETYDAGTHNCSYDAFLLAADANHDGSVTVEDYSVSVDAVVKETAIDQNREDPAMVKGAETEIEAQLESETEVTPDFQLTYNGKVLVKDVDYTVSFANNTSVGKAYATVTGTANGAFSGSKTFTFTILARDPNSFTSKLLNSANMLYRIGNLNTVTLANLFTANGSVDSSDVTVNFETVGGTAKATYTANTTDWSQGTVQFSGLGVIKVKISNGNSLPVTLILEVVDGKNITAAENASSNNIILLNDITATAITVSSNRVLYGNGFTVTDARESSKGYSALVTLSGGTLDNVKIRGAAYSTFQLWPSSDSDCSATCVRAYGASYIYNSYISGCRLALEVSSGTPYAKNTTFDGGSYANICIYAGRLTLEDCITTSDTNGGLKALGIMLYNSNAGLTIKGSLKQYNWLTKSEVSKVSTLVTSIANDVFNNSTYAYNDGSNTYINMGVLCFNESEDITEDRARRMVVDETDNEYGYLEKNASILTVSCTATCYLPKATLASKVFGTCPTYVSKGQYVTVPTFSFNYTSKNYVAKTSATERYCYYFAKTDTIYVNFKSEEGKFDWDTSILTTKKFGSSIPYTVSMNGVDYTGKKISFTQAGDYTVQYTYVDHNNYSLSNNNISLNDVTYEKTLHIKVTIYDSSAPDRSAKFTYTDGSATKQVIISNNIYVMPDVSATSDTIGSTTISGTTVYYPIVSTSGQKKGGGTYSSGKMFFYNPAFTAINITDYNQDTGAIQYSYNKSATAWPHGQSELNGPNTTVFGYDYNSPYGVTSTTYQGFNKTSAEGLCFEERDLEQDSSEKTMLVRFYYVSTDGSVYYYYIGYHFIATTYKSCFAKGTMITLADGSQKPIENITYNDKVLTWNFFTGDYEAKNIAILVDHGEDTYRVLTTEYSDGTSLRTIGDHGVFDYDENQYIYLTEGNYRDYIGHRFVKQGENGEYELVTLTNAYVTDEVTNAYSITSVGNSNAFAEGLLTVAPPDDFYNWIEMGDKLRYDTEQFQEDVNTYGLYDYDVFKDYVTYEQYVAFNGAYLKIPVEKGCFTFEYILELIELYSKWMPQEA